MSNAVAKFDSLLSQSDFVFLVYFRGHWCPFCMAYIRSLNTIIPSIEAANGTVVIATAEDPKFLPDTLAKTGYKGATIVDPSNVLVRELKARELIDVAISAKSGYPEGMAQPAVLVVRRGGEKVVGWAIQPALMNLGGAKDRAVLSEVWEDAKKRLDDPVEAKKPQKVYGTEGVLSVWRN